LSNLSSKIATPDGSMYCKIRWGKYDLSQASIIAQKLLEECLNKHVFCQSQTTPGLWKQDTPPIIFSLIVHNFGIKYVGEENTQHLLDTVRTYFKCLCNWEKEHYCVLTMKWVYLGKKVHLPMPGYVSKVLICFQYLPPSNPKTKYTPMSSPHTQPRHSMPRRRTIPPYWTRWGRSSFSRFVAHFFFLHAGLMVD
jgi:hypothetical protein